MLYFRWPQLKKILDHKVIDFHKEIQYIFNLRHRTREILETMPPKLYKKHEISDSDLQEWYSLVQERVEVYHYLVIDLMEIVNNDVSIKSIETVPFKYVPNLLQLSFFNVIFFSTPGNKTMQYYANKVLRFIRQLHLSTVWKDYMALPSERQVLEIGAVLVAQWCQPNIEVTLDDISAKLDNIAEEVKQALKISYPGKFKSRFLIVYCYPSSFV